MNASSAGGAHITPRSDFAAVGGVSFNEATFDPATIAGGDNYFATGYESTVPGGGADFADGNYSFAAGQLARAEHDGTFVWSDHSGTPFSSTGADQFLVRASGGMGINTTSPATQLHVKKSANGTATNLADNVVVFENTNTGNSADVLALKIGGTGNPTASNNFITFLLGDNTSVGAIQGNGSMSVEYVGSGNDYAEWLPRQDLAESLAAGDIVGIVEGRVTKDTRQASQVMVVSTAPLVSGNDPGEAKRGDNTKVAFIGQALVKVRGPVRAGDFIVPSGLNDGEGLAVAPGAIKAQQFSQVVGQAWESSPESELRSVRVAVGLIQHDPTVQRLVETNAAQAEQLVSLEARMSAIEKGRARNPNGYGSVWPASPVWC